MHFIAAVAFLASLSSIAGAASVKRCVLNIDQTPGSCQQAAAKRYAEPVSGVFARACAADNCARAVTGTATLPNRPDATSRAADCSVFVQNTAGPVPTYASACSGAVRYSSACSCFGITSTPTPTPTSTSTTSTTSTSTSTTPTCTAKPTGYAKDPAFDNLCPPDLSFFSSYGFTSETSQGLTPAQLCLKYCTDAGDACKFALLQAKPDNPADFTCWLYGKKPAPPTGACAAIVDPAEGTGSDKLYSVCP